MSDYVLGIDLGTSGCKAVLFDLDLKIICSSNSAFQTGYPQKGWAEHDTGQWWQGVLKAIKEILSKSKINPGNIAGIGFDTMSPVVLPVDEQGNALTPALIWMDRRAEKQAKWLEDNLKESILKINGNHIDPSFMASKVLWIKENKPEIYKKTQFFLHANGYLVHKLTGQFSMDRSQCGLSQLCDTAKGEWSEELIKNCGLDMKKMPPMFNSFDIVGKITGKAAKETGLKEGTPVVAGAMDNVAAGLGAGVYKKGQVYVSAGTVTNAGVCIDKPVYKEEMHIYHHIVPGMWLTVGGVDYGGAGIKWFNEILGEKDYNEITKLANASFYNEDPLIFLPYMVGQRAPIWNTNTRGVIFGLSPSTNKQNLVRMLMEGTAFGTRKILEIVEKENIEINQIKMTGGSTNIEAWVQCFADINKKEIEVPGEMDVAPLGAAITACYGAGISRNFEDLIGKIKLSGSYKPKPERTGYYDKMFQIFSRLYDSVLPVYKMLADLNRNV